MSEIVRFGVSLDRALVRQFDEYLKAQNYSTRSQAIGDLLRQALVEKHWVEGDAEVAGAVMLVYDHHKRELMSRLMHIQHDFHHLIVSSQHIHLDHDNCLEVVVVRGRGEVTNELVRQLRAEKGVAHVSLSITSAGG